MTTNLASPIKTTGVRAPKPHAERQAPLRITPAKSRDIGALVALEKSVFLGDRLSARSLRELIGKKSARLFVARSRDDESVGYVLILFRKATSVARLYSVAVAPQARGQGIAKALIAAAEEEARRHHALFMRLEVRADNTAAKALYKGLGYRLFGRHLDYYEDHADALRYEKSLVATPPRTRRTRRRS